MYTALKNRFFAWLFQTRGPQRGPLVLVQRRVFILPTRQGLGFAAVLLLMLAGSINYSLSLGFVLTFLLAAMGIVAMLHTFRNLAGLRLSAGRTQPVFAGDMARFVISVENVSDSDRYSIGLTRDRRQAEFADVPARQGVLLGIDAPAPRRGLLPAGRLTLFTRYPLGLYHAWAYLEPEAHCLVYPRPAPPGRPLPLPEHASSGQGCERAQGQEDFSGLRQYHPGDSSRHIAWKAVARDQGMLTKQFSGHADSTLWLAWEALPAHMGPEDRLSQLTRWVLDADALGLSYGLRLPGRALDAAAGEAQRARCLEALALFDATARQ